MTKSLLSVALCSLLAACATSGDRGPGGDPTKSDGDDLPPGKLSVHASTIWNCMDEFDNAEAEDDAGVIAILNRMQSCLEQANRDAIPLIDKLAGGGTETIINRYETAAEAFCALMTDAHDDPEDPTSTVAIGATCRGHRAHNLATSIDELVAFVGTDKVEYKPDVERDLFESCFRAFDAAPPSGLVAAYGALATCVESETKRVAGEYVVERLAAQGMSEDDARAKVGLVVDLSLRSARDACAHLVKASGVETAGQPALQAHCEADAVGLLGRYVVALSAIE